MMQHKMYFIYGIPILENHTQLHGKCERKQMNQVKTRLEAVNDMEQDGQGSEVHFKDCTGTKSKKKYFT